MKIISDLHIHSKYSRATSKDLDFNNLEKYARIKGLNLLGTGDFTHPKWIQEIKNNLEEDGTGILKSKTGFNFLLSSEISLIYTQNNKGRKIHNIFLAPSIGVVEQINDSLKKKGRLDYDGRPIFGMSCVEFVDMMKNIDKDIEIIPAHVWTPWFSLFGSMSGFDKIEDCFQEQTKHVHALETGLSSDPAMNWRLSALDKYSLVSFSDSHSFWPWRIGREATVFDLKGLTYKNIISALKTKEGLNSTIEFWPEEGKYYYDGHRNCNICLNPSESIKKKDRCPKCGRTLTIGVAHRIELLADREEGFKPKDAAPFVNLIPLAELTAGALNCAVSAKKNLEEYFNLIKSFNNELNILLNVPEEELNKATKEKIAELIIKNRNQKIKVKPGYDGVYGIPIFDNNQIIEEKGYKIKDKQTDLNEF